MKEMIASAPFARSFIGGTFVDSTSSSTWTSSNPANSSDFVAEFATGSREDACRAVDAAQSAYPSWSGLTGMARAEFLNRWAEVIEARTEELAVAMTREVGKPIVESRGEVARCAVILRYYAGEAVRPQGQVIPCQMRGALQYSIRGPLGVVAMITPWNFPLAIPLWKLGPALAMGNTAVLKCAEASSWMGRLLAETTLEAELPEGVVNLLLGSGPILGDALLDDNRVRALSFTGSAKVGRHLAARCADRGIKFQGEMGGKNVAIVLPDADLDVAAKWVASGAMRFAGQKCTGTSRVVVDSAIRTEFREKLAAAVVALPVGDPTEESTAVGPVISAESRQRIDEAVSRAESEVLYKGEVPQALNERGHYVSPQVHAVADPKAEICQTELFGPILVELTANGFDEAIELANQSEYGLSASLFTRDLPAALQYVSRIEAGMVRVNADTTGVDPHAPFGGVKGSSTHSREQGPVAVDFYSEVKTVQISG